MNLLAFDLGASSGKLFLAELSDGKVSFQEIHRFENSAYSISGGLYWDIIYLYQQMNEGIQKAIDLTGDRIDSFGIDSFSNDFGFVDSNGALLSPVRCYRDKRTERFKKQIYEKMSKEQLHACSGNQNALFNTLMQLAAMKEAGQDMMFEHGHKMLFIPDLLIYFLTGKTNAEYTISSVSQMFSFRKDNWSEEILSAYQLPREMFGELIKPGTVVGNTHSSYNKQMKTRGFPVVAVCEHDTASAYLASCCRTDCALISSGTWALVGTEIDRPIITEETCRYNFANEGGYNRYRLLRNVMGSWLIQEVKKYYRSQGHDYSYDELDQLAQCAPAFRYFIDVDDELFFQPGNIPEKIGAYCISRYHSRPETVGAIVRCIYESLAMKYRWVIEKLEHIVQKPLPVINILGGGSKAEMMCQFTANACKKNVLSGPAEASAIGNISVQLLALHAVSSIDQATELMQNTYKIKTYSPADVERWETEYKNYLKQFGG